MRQSHFSCPVRADQFRNETVSVRTEEAQSDLFNVGSEPAAWPLSQYWVRFVGREKIMEVLVPVWLVELMVGRVCKSITKDHQREDTFRKPDSFNYSKSIDRRKVHVTRGNFSDAGSSYLVEMEGRIRSLFNPITASGKNWKKLSRLFSRTKILLYFNISLTEVSEDLRLVTQRRGGVRGVRVESLDPQSRSRKGPELKRLCPPTLM